MKYIVQNSNNPYFNMAFDEYCLENIDCEEPFFFLWQNEPTVVIGANQNAYKEVDLEYLEKNKIHLVRRFSGGGAVYHDNANLNFTFIGKFTQDKEVFEQYIGYIIDALQQMGLEDVAMTGRNDILMKGMKISGCAKRIFKDKCMVHGTLLYDVDTTILKNVLNGPKSKMKLRGTSSVSKQVANIKDYLPQLKNVSEFKQELENILSENGKDCMVLTPQQIAEVEAIGEEKYASKSWVYGKMAKSNICYESKLKCGTIEAEMVVNGDTIESVHFNGDFIGDKNVKELEPMFEGLKYNHSNLIDFFERVEPNRYFDGAMPADLTNLMLGAEVNL
ncbi:MAG: lipoate--protein ligase [Bacteroidetes bacterium]|nr:lipoate--protein ligase [Bacteroidota bacterium]